MKNEYVMVPREPTAEMLAAAKKSGVIDPRVSGHCYELMVAAEQHQGEPVALPDRREYPDSDDKERYGPFDPKYDEDCAEAEGWNACLDEIVKLGPLYTHADPGEVEKANKLAETAADQVVKLLAQLRDANDKLAERDGLLREASAAIKQGDVDFDAVYSACRSWDELVKDREASEVALKIDAALSASAEPSAPVELDERQEFESAWSARIERLRIRERGNEFYRVQPNDLYRWNNVQDAWELWQARAALGRKP